MPRPTPEPRIARVAARQHGVFTRAQALEAGCTPRAIAHRLRAGRWHLVHRGVYRMAGSRVTLQQQAMAACLAAGPKAFASYRTAAALLGLRAAGDAIEVSVPPGSRRSRPGVRLHEFGYLLPGDVATVDGVPATSPTRTILDLAAVATPRELQEIVERALSRGLTTLGRLERRLTRAGGQGRSGVRALRHLIGTLPGDGTPESNLEWGFLRLFQRAGFLSLRPQVPVTIQGRRYRLDFADPDRRVAIEIDGRHHQLAARRRLDVERQEALESDDWTVLRFRATDRRRAATVIGHLARVLPRVESA